MKTRIGTFLCLLFLCLQGSQAQMPFVNIYGDGSSNIYNEVKFNTALNAFFAVGQRGNQPCVSRIDVNGNIEWTKTFMQNATEASFFSLDFNPNNQDIVVAGLDFSRNPSELVYYRLNSAGVFQSGRSYAIPSSQRVVRPIIMHSVGSVSDYILSYANVPNNADGVVMDNLGLMRIEANGDVVWSREYFTDRTGHDDQFYALIPNAQGGITYACYTQEVSNFSFIGSISGTGTFGPALTLKSDNVDAIRIFDMEQIIVNGSTLTVLGGIDKSASDGNTNGRGIYMVINEGQGTARRIITENTAIRSVTATATGRIIMMGSPDNNTMDILTPFPTLPNSNILLANRFSDINYNTSAQLNSVGDLGIITNTIANNSAGFGGVDNMLALADFGNDLTTCISDPSLLFTEEVTLNPIVRTINTALLTLVVDDLGDGQYITYQNNDLCCACENLNPCFETCTENACIDCSVTLTNCTTDGCGNDAVDNPFLWTVTNAANGVVSTSTLETIVLTPADGAPVTVYQVCLTATNNAGCEETRCDLVNVFCLNEEEEEPPFPPMEYEEDQSDHSQPFPLEELLQEKSFESFSTESTNDIQITPNPAQAKVQIDFGSLQGEQVQIAVFNSQGQLVQQESLGAVTGIATLDLDLPNGVYVIKIREGSQPISEHKLLIQK